MYVLIDVEWFQQAETTKYLTQIAASRFSETWESTAEFSSLVRPPDAGNCDWEHMAYNGYSPHEVMNSGSEAACIEHFAAFLKEDDTLCVWSKETKKIIREKYELYTGNALPNSCVCVNDKVYTAAKNRGINVFEMYAVAEKMGIETPVPKHCSINDLAEPWFCDYHIYKEWHLTECFFSKMKAFRRIATRYDKLATSFLRLFISLQFGFCRNSTKSVPFQMRPS